MSYFLFWLCFAIAAAVVAHNKGRSGVGWFVLGLLLGPMAFIFALIIRKDTPRIEARSVDAGELRRCPFCAELIRPEAKLCRYCGRDISSASESAPQDVSVISALHDAGYVVTHPTAERWDVAAPGAGKRSFYSARELSDFAGHVRPHSA